MISGQGLEEENMHRFSVVSHPALLIPVFFLIACSSSSSPGPVDEEEMTDDLSDQTVSVDEAPDEMTEGLTDGMPDESAEGTPDETIDEMPDDATDDIAADDPVTDNILADEAPDTDTTIPPGAINIVVLSDIHFSGDAEKIEQAQKIIAAINNKEGDFPAVDALVITGDVISKIYPDWPDTTECHIDVATTTLAPLSVPYYLGLGNHDYNLGYQDTNWGGPFTEQEILQAEAVWLEKAGTAPYFAVTIKGWKLIFLNSMRGYYLKRNFDDAQLVWFATELSDGVPAFVFLHHPIETDNFKVWTGPNETVPKLREPQFYQILSDYRNTVKAILVGHGHLWVSDTLHGTIPVQETASLGETSILSGDEPHTIIEGKPDLTVKVKVRKDL